MDNILRKALDEAFTAEWAAELDNIGDTDHVFAPAVELEMRKTVKKAKAPILFYTNYIAAVAACVVIAVGATFIMPAITSTRVKVDENDNKETTSAVISETVRIEEDDYPIACDDEDDCIEDNEDDEDDEEVSSDIVVEPPPSDDAPDDTGVLAEDTVVTDTPVEDTVDEAPSLPDTDDDIAVADTTVYDETEDYGPDNSDTDWPNVNTTDDAASKDNADDDISDDDVAEDDSSLESLDGDDDGVVSGDTATDDFDLEGDDANPATGGDGDHDVDYDDDGDDDVCDDSGGITIIPPSADEGKKNPYPDSGTLSGLFKNISSQLSYSSLAVNSSSLVSGNNKYQLYADAAYLNDFIRNSESAPFLSRSSTPTSSYITLYVCDCTPVKSNIRFRNSSQWLHYNSIYYNGTVVDDAFDYDVDDEDYPDYSFSVTLNVYRNGVISVERIVTYSPYKEYKDTMYFTADVNEVKKLFEGAEKTLIPSSVATAGALAKAMNITSGNIKDAVVDIEGVYDSWINGMKVSGPVIEEFFRENSDQRISSMSKSGRFVYCGFDLTDIGTRLRVSVTSDKCIVRSYNGQEIAFPVTRDSYEKLIVSAANENGLNIPIYKTLADFVSDKNFTALDSAYARNGDTAYKIPVGAETEALFAEMKNELPHAEYSVNKYTRSAVQYVCLKMRGWGYDLTIYSDDTVQIGWNVFQASSGFYNKMKKLITESPNMTAESMYRTDFYVSFDDDDDVERNPITD